MGRITMDRFPASAYIEDGLLIIGEEAWTPAEFALYLRARPEYPRTLNAMRVARWRKQNPEKVREQRARYRAKRRAA